MRQPVEFQNKYKMKTFLGCYGDYAVLLEVFTSNRIVSVHP